MVLDTIISSMVDLITDPIKEDIVMPINCDRNLKRLRDEVEQLQNKRIRLQHSVEEAIRNGEEIFPDATNWLSTTEKDIEEAELILGEEEEAKKKLLGGIFPNFRTLYQLSKKADEKALAVHDQLQNARGLYPISFRPRLQPIVEHGEALQSRVEILDQIVEALKDPILNPILVYGMGGIGKTTLAKEVLRQAVDLKLFDDVALVAVSETPNLRRIQGDLADALGLTFRAEGDSGRAMELHNRLNNDQKKVLIIFDDVWEELHLSDIGIPSGEPSKGCRIILTSRKKNVFCIEMPTKKEFPLGLLEEDEAWRLFEKIVSIEFLADNRDFCDLAKQVVNKCGGLPLLIQIVAADLRNNKHPHAWRDMLKQLESVKGTEMYDKVHKVIESSYEKMKEEEAKSLFLLCPLFGNSNIQIYNLLIYCVGLGLCKRDSIEESRDRVLTLIDKLKNESLLLEGDKAGFVKIHDVVRDIAAAIASKEHGTFVGKGRIESRDLEREDCRRISLPYCEILGLPKVLPCPETEVLSLFAVRDIPDLFFNGVGKLKVLHLSWVGFKSGLPSSLSFLTGLQTLSLDGCRRLTNVAMVALLKQLKVLSFADSDVEELPKEIKALTQLKLLDLTDCEELKVIPSNVLSNLHSLEELYMLNKYDGWDTEGNASLVELKNLSRLKTLEIVVKDDKLLPEDWFFNGIQDYKISIGDWFGFDDRQTSRMLKLELKTRNSLMHRIKEFMGGIEILYLGEVNGIENLLYDSSMKKMNSFQKLQCLHLWKCDSLREVLPFSREKCLPHLEEMKVEYCSNMEAIVGEGNEDEVMELTQLTSLKLGPLPNLRGICRTGGTVSFPNLTSLVIGGCKSLKYVFTTSMVKSLKQLKELDISFCQSMEEIIRVNEFEEAAEHIINEDEVMEFPQLTSLRLSYLSICRISGGTVSFPSVTNLEIFECKSLKYVFTTSMVKSLKQLKKLYICTCHSIEEIILVNECEEVIVFPQLKDLQIAHCSSLKSFVWKDSDRSNNNEYFFNELVTLPNLEIMHIEEMVNLRYLWHKQFADNKSFSKLKSLRIRNCEKLSVVFPSNEYRRFERLESLLVSKCSTVKEIYEYEWSKDIDEAFSFQYLQSVIVRNCPELKSVIPASIACGLLQLQHLKIKHCGVEMIIAELKNEGSEGSSIRTFEWPNLKSLIIRDCDKLIKFGSIISKGKHNIATPDSVYFIQKVIPNVEVLKLDRHSLRAIQSDDHEFPSELLRKLKEVTLAKFEEESVPVLFDFLRRIYSLEKLVIVDCCLGERLSLLDERATGDQQQQCNLGLKLKHIVKEDSRLNPILQSLNIAPPRPTSSSSSSPSVSFKNLTTLHVKWCKKMTSLVTASTAKSLIQLTEFKVEFCEMMEGIIVADVYDGDCTEEHDSVITFSKLEHLELNGLPSLKSFCSGNYTFNFPLLERVFIEECDQMKNFCGGVVSTPKLKWIHYEESHQQLCDGNLNDTIARLVVMLEDGEL